jgi:hypothetical protein
MPDVAAATAKLEQANKNELAILRSDTIPGVGRALLALRRNLQTIRGNPRNSIQAMQDDTAAARASAQKALDTLESTAKMAVSNIRNDIATRLETKRDTSEQLVYELQKQGARRQLDLMVSAGAQTEDMISSLAGRGDVMGLACLREDLTLGLFKSDLSKDTLLVLLDQQETPLLSGVQQAARLLEAELAAGSANLVTSFALARGEAQGASSTSGGTLLGPVTTIADWGRGQAYRIEFPMDAVADGGNTSAPTPTAPGTTGVQFPAAPQPTVAQTTAEYMNRQNRR